MAAETIPTGAVALFSAATGTAFLAAMASIGLDPVSMGAGLCGCVVIRTILPTRDVKFSEIALVTCGSVIFASFATPWFSPVIAKLASVMPGDVSHGHVKVSTAFIAGAFPKPLLMGARATVLRIAQKLAKTAGEP